MRHEHGFGAEVGAPPEAGRVGASNPFVHAAGIPLGDAMLLSIPNHAPAPDRTDPRDLAFFALHPERRFRARAPFREELRQAKLLGRLSPLAPGQEYATIVSRLGADVITTVLAKVRLDLPGVYPDSDEDIDRAFRRPKTPKGVPA